MNVEGAKG